MTPLLMHQPGTSEYRRYGNWMIERIMEWTGPLPDLGNLCNTTLEILYEQIVGKNPGLAFRLYAKET